MDLYEGLPGLIIARKDVGGGGCGVWGGGGGQPSTNPVGGRKFPFFQVFRCHCCSFMAGPECLCLTVFRPNVSNAEGSSSVVFLKQSVSCVLKAHNHTAAARRENWLH